MFIVIPRGSRVHQERDQLFGVPGILTLPSLYEGTRGKEDVHVERSAQDPVQGDTEGPS